MQNQQRNAYIPNPSTDAHYISERHAANVAIWPLGNRDEDPPLWSQLVKDWVTNAHPRGITHLIAELEKLGDVDDDTCTAYWTHKACLDAADWRGSCEELGWESCADIIDTLCKAGLEPAKRFEIVDALLPAAWNNDTDALFSWVREVPEWQGESTVMVPQSVTLEFMSDENVYSREKEDEHILNRIQDSPSYALKKDDNGATLGEIAKTCAIAAGTWLVGEYLSQITFVNRDDQEWDDAISWRSLGESLGMELEPAAVSEWFLVDEHAANQLAALGGVVVDLPGVGFAYGRVTSGQALHMDGIFERAMVRSGYLEYVPPLGALNEPGECVPSGCSTGDSVEVPGYTVSLGGQEFPFSVPHTLPLHELCFVLLREDYREAGFLVEFGGVEFNARSGETVTFRVTPPGV